MKNVLKLLASLALSVAGHAQVDYTGAIYEQNFDTLPVYDGAANRTASFSFTSNSTLPGWYAGVDTRNGNARSSAGARQSGLGNLYNWGSIGSPDRALGTFSADGYGGDTVYFGVQLRNGTGAVIDALAISFVVEQWRRNVNATTWTFDYLVTGDTGNRLSTPGFTNVAAANVTAPHTTGAGARDGNAPGQYVPVNATLTGLDWRPGEYLWLRWGNNQGEASSGLGLDDLVVRLP